MNTATVTPEQPAETLGRPFGSHGHIERWWKDDAGRTWHLTATSLHCDDVAVACFNNLYSAFVSFGQN